MCSPWRSGSPQKTDSFALSAIGFVSATDSKPGAGFWSGPPNPTSQLPTYSAIQFSMIVVITSWAPTVALRTPAIPAQSAPATAATLIAIRMWTGFGSEANQIPVWTPAIAPTVYWPFPPMLNRPHRNANATASPVNTSGVNTSSVWIRLSAASLVGCGAPVVFSVLVSHGNQTCQSVNGTPIECEPTSRNQLRPAPLKIALYVPSGFSPVKTRTARPPIRKATTTVTS